MTESWQGIVTTISNSVGKEKLKLSEVVSLILTEEVRIGSIEDSSSGSGPAGSALNVEQRGRSYTKGGYNQNQNGNRSKSKGKPAY